MSAHLPECHLTLEPLLSAQDWCICAELRACEARTLDAARDAVAALTERMYGFSGYDWVPEGQALAAIDALRGER